MAWDHDCEVLYPMLGETARSELAAALGAETAPDCGELVVDDHQRTSVPACTLPATWCGA
jgi:thioredoxin reductase (NADPH)